MTDALRSFTPPRFSWAGAVMRRPSRALLALTLLTAALFALLNGVTEPVSAQAPQALVSTLGQANGHSGAWAGGPDP